MRNLTPMPVNRVNVDINKCTAFNKVSKRPRGETIQHVNISSIKAARHSPVENGAQQNILACSQVRGLVKKRWTLAIARNTEKPVTSPLKARKIAIGCVGQRLSNEIFLVNAINELLSRINCCASSLYCC